MTRIVLPGEPLCDGPTALRPWRDTDIPALVAACQDPEIIRWTRVPVPYGPTDARAYLLQRFDAVHAGLAAPFAIVDAGDLDRLLGSISLLRIDWPHRRGEVGYWLGPEGRGAGHATRAVGLICQFGIAKMGLERIDLLAATGNTASLRVAERSGFRREAVLRAHMRSRDGWLDMVAHGLLAPTARRRFRR